LNTLLPAMGGVSVVLAITLAVLSKQDPRCRDLLVGAALLMIVAAAVTRFGNQPINAVTMQWSPQSPAQTGLRCATNGGTGTSRAPLLLSLRWHSPCWPSS